MKLLHLFLITLVSFLIFGIMQSTPVRAEQANITFIKSVFPNQNAWDAVFNVQATNPACAQGKSILDYENFLAAAEEYSDFCGNLSKKENVHELAAFLANASLETNGAARGQYNGGLCFSSQVGCENGGCNYCNTMNPPWNTAPKCPYGYYGRGALQITNPYNYNEASEDLYGDNRFYEDPDLVLEDNNAWKASINYWVNHKGGLTPSATSIQGTTTCHAAIDGGDFGKTVEVINGNNECTNPSPAMHERTQVRIAYYKTYVPIFAKQVGVDVEPVTHLQCSSGTPTPPSSGYRCGKDWNEANSGCTKSCENRGDCATGEDCFANVNPNVCN